ncbi:hypothetical protein MJH12_16445 [bacterium]|nr:hypothetical protein [bacterium]
MKKSSLFENSRILIIGSDNTGWSIDQDRQNTINAFNAIKLSLVNNPITNHIFYFVWWNICLGRRYKIYKLIFPWKNWVAVVTNDMNHQVAEFLKAKKLIDHWVCANQSQIKFLQENGICPSKIFYQPFHVRENIFTQLVLDKVELCKELNINYQLIENKVLIGSFQRDTLLNLKEEKWQKNPQQIVDAFKKLDKKKYLLILAGPRRHFLVNQCKVHNIPYLFIGDESYMNQKLDDNHVNNLSPNKINLLYNLIDTYLISSKSEGGPKAVIESALTKTAILSTSIGMAPDLLHPECIYHSTNELIDKIINNTITSKIISYNYQKVSEVNCFKNYCEQIRKATNFSKV